MTKEKKLLIISDSFPPLLDASAVLVNNIFSKYKGNMEALGGTNFTRYDKTFLPPCKAHYFRHPRNRVFEAISRRFHLLFLPLYYWFCLYWSKRIKPDVIFANFPHEVMFVAGCQAARKLNIPLYIYMHDMWEENRDGSRLAFASKWEKTLFTHAAKVICATSAQQEHYRKKYPNIHTELIPHPIPDEELQQPKAFRQSDGSKITMAYSGSLSAGMNQDAFVEIGKALDLLPDNYEMVWLPINPINPDVLSQLGISHRKMRFEYVDREGLKIELEKATMLIAPLSHKNCKLEEIKTVFSNKLLGYLVSGKPILVFGPSNCHHVQLARSGNWGFIVDEDTPEALAKGIMTLATDTSLQKSLVEATLKEAERRRASIFADIVLDWVNHETRQLRKG